MEQFTHKCIKCNITYKDSDPDDYYCTSCNTERKKIASEIDKKLSGRVSRNVVSGLQEYDNAIKVRGFATAKSLGII
jgi:uncharacterized Zn ribbon protein